MRRSPTIQERFDNKVRRTHGCWHWIGAKTKAGYGTLTFSGLKRTTTTAHRISWELAHERHVPDDNYVLHKCDNPGCVNPKHLFLGTHQDNMDDMQRKGRQSKGYRRGAVLKGRRHWMRSHPDKISRGEEHGRANRPHRGEDNYGAAFIKREVEAIREEYKNGGISQLALARRYGVAQTTISRVVRHVRYTTPKYPDAPLGIKARARAKAERLLREGVK